MAIKSYIDKLAAKVGALLTRKKIKAAINEPKLAGISKEIDDLKRLKAIIDTDEAAEMCNEYMCFDSICNCEKGTCIKFLKYTDYIDKNK